MEAASSDQINPGQIRRAIKRIMERDGVGQLELARRTGMKRQQLYEYLRDENPVEPGVRNLQRIAFALGVSVDELLADG